VTYPVPLLDKNPGDTTVGEFDVVGRVVTLDMLLKLLTETAETTESGRLFQGLVS